LSQVLHLTTILFFSAFMGFAQEIETPAGAVESAQAAASAAPARQSALQHEILDPVRQFFNSVLELKPAGSGTATPVIPPTTAFQAERGCSVAPLDPIEETTAAHLELSGANVVDIEGMVPAAAVALGKFQVRVTRLGGKIVLGSAYRPAAYQKHLQNVWYKWMSELKDNHRPACQILRGDVEEEFTRHRLMETQHPVAVSDHTRGLAFDAKVDLPPKAKLGRRKVTLDGLARLAGLLRPAILADPVHFKFLGIPNVHVPGSRRRHNA
jgi:hypothetical protein